VAVSADKFGRIGGMLLWLMVDAVDAVEETGGGRSLEEVLGIPPTAPLRRTPEAAFHKPLKDIRVHLGDAGAGAPSPVNGEIGRRL
jgi:hypothetical protein